MATNTTPRIRAWTYTTGGYPTCLTLSSFAAPALPSSPPAGEKGTHLVIRTTAAALNPVDIQLMNLALFTPGKALPFPLSTAASTLWPLNALAQRVKGVGADFAGEVVAAHAGCGFAVGERVFGLAFAPGAARGTLSEALLLDAASDVVLRVPPGWTDVQAAALPLVALTARTCVQRCVGFVDDDDDDDDDGTENEDSTKNNTLVVLGGASATGLYTTLLAAARGWRVVATCSSPKAGLVRAMGAAETIDYTAFSSSSSSSSSSSAPPLRSAIAAARPAAIVDCVGGTEQLGVPGVRRYVTIVGDKTARGALGGAATYAWNPRMALRALAGAAWVPRALRRCVAATAVGRWARLGGHGGEERYACVNLEARADWLQEVVRVVDGAGAGAGAEQKVVVDSVYAFDDVRSAFERLDSGTCSGKVVVEIPGQPKEVVQT